MSKPYFMVKIGEAAKIVGVHPNTLRRWEEQGLITPMVRTGGTGTRYYDRRDLDRMVTGEAPQSNEGKYLAMHEIEALIGGSLQGLNVEWGTGPAMYRRSTVEANIDELRRYLSALQS